jgi:phosphoglycolate phosphatase-like HAD superfamily hydrolase
MDIDSNLIALDADGVLVDYHEGYANAWGRAFGSVPAALDPHAYWAVDRYGVERLDPERKAHFRTHFDEGFWSTLPAIDGAVDACHALRSAGFRLVCVSAIRPEHREARERNLRDLGFPIDAVFDAHGESSTRSPKADALHRLRPAAFVDDFLPYFRGVDAQIHRALIDRSPNGSPNRGPEVPLLADSSHADLAAFATFWIQSRGAR